MQMTDISKVMLANNAYKNVASAKFGAGVPDIKDSSMNFYDIAQAAFKQQSKMSSDMILSEISAKGISHPNLGIAAEALRKLNKELNVTQKVTGKAITDEASLMDLSFATNRSKHILETFVKFRDTIIQSLDKIFNMQI
jgi:flagellar hook-basal body complex protein FliE